MQTTPIDTTPAPQKTTEPSPPADQPIGQPADRPASPLRDAMLEALGALSDEQRRRLTAADAPEDQARIWRDLIAERALQERQTELIDGVLDELDARERRRIDEIRANRSLPTRGLRGDAPSPEPDSVAAWTTYIRDAKSAPDTDARRARFAGWLSQHPDA